jgi:DNA polymerase elongation subunit (family B)
MKHVAKQVSFQNALEPQQQYTYACTIGNRIFSRARSNDGAPIYVEQEYTPVYFLPLAWKDKANATHWGYEGQPLYSHMCDNIRDGKQFLERNEGRVYGDIQPEYMALHDTYGANEAPWELERLYIWDIDIEVDRDAKKGYAPVDDPFNPIISITVEWSHTGKSGTVVYAVPPDANAKFVPPEGVTYVECKTEEELILKFLDDFRAAGDYPDIITGWHVQFFDIPYIVNRAKKLFTEEIWIRFSPLQRLAERKVIINHQDQTVIDIKGVSILDYYELYQKFTYSQQENYRLDHIAYIELGERKISYKEVRLLDRLYRENYQKFLEYNIRDVRLVMALNERGKTCAGLIELVCALTYSSKCNFADTFKQVRLWDIMIYHKLRADGYQIPPRKAEAKTEQYEGAFVKEPITGLHEWVVSFDVASMYPHIIREWNLSPEMIAKERVEGYTVDDLLKRNADTSELQKKDYAMSANGVLTRRDKEGFLANMMKTLYAERIKFKKMMKQAKTKLVTETDPVKQKQLKKEMATYDRAQLVRKVNLNSAYGATGSNYFRFYSTALAEAVTVTGQLIIRWVAQDLNAFLNKAFGTNIDYVVYSDTDSVYLRLGTLVERFRKVKPDATNAQLAEVCHQFGETKLQPVINKSLDELGDYLNGATKCLSMVRDCIAEKGVWTAKKRYILNLWDSEGTRYEKPKLYVKGLETVKSSTPAVCRDRLQTALNLFMNGTQQQLWDFVKESEAQFRSAPFEDIAFPRACNNLRKYRADDKGVPIQVRGAMAFNEGLNRTNLETKYQHIQEGEKVKFAYLRQPNIFRCHVLSAPGGCPAEWNIERVIDYDTQWDKAFVEPLETILSVAGWSTKYEASLFD